MLFFFGYFIWCVFVSQGAPAEHEPGLRHRVLAAKPRWVHLDRPERQQKVLNQLFHQPFLSLTSSSFLVTHFLTSSLLSSCPPCTFPPCSWVLATRLATMAATSSRFSLCSASPSCKTFALFVETRCGGGPYWEYWGRSNGPIEDRGRRTFLWDATKTPGWDAETSRGSTNNIAEKQSEGSDSIGMKEQVRNIRITMNSGWH